MGYDKPINAERFKSLYNKKLLKKRRRNFKRIKSDDDVTCKIYCPLNNLFSVFFI